MASRSKKRIKLHKTSDESDNNSSSDEGPNSSGFKASKKMEKNYSLEKYRSLLDYFRDFQVLTVPESANIIADRIRMLAEFLIYGQKINESIYFEEFIEENVCIRHFTRFLNFKNRVIQIQVI